MNRVSRRDLSAKYPDVVKELTGYLNEMTQTLPESRGRAPTPGSG